MPEIKNKELAADIGKKIKEAKEGGNPSPAPVHMQHYAKEQISIIRQVCIKAAAHALSGSSHSKVKANEVVEMAEEFEKWITR